MVGEFVVDPFRLCLALGPLSIYLLLVGAINLSRRPLLVSGARDTAALGMGLCGLLFVGPIELLLPKAAIVAFTAPYVWLMLLLMYALGLSLWVLLSRPRLVVYNIGLDEFRPLLAEVIDTLDKDARWAGGSLYLPRLHVELFLDQNVATRNVSLIATGQRQSYLGWRQLEQALAARLRSAESPPNLWGLGMAGMASLMFVRMGWELVFNQQAVTQGFADMLRLN
jgi:hypothetical protein